MIVFSYKSRRQNLIVVWTVNLPHTVLLHHRVRLDLELRKRVAYRTKSFSNVLSERHSTASLVNDCQNGEDGHKDDQFGRHFQLCIAR